MQNENLKLKNLRDQEVGVLGLGQENLVLIKYLVGSGAKVVVCDQKPKGELNEHYEQIKNLPIQFRLGPHYLDHLEDFKIIFRAPGLPYLNPKIQQAKKDGVEISSQIKLFFSLCPSPIIGVTGTKGKGTTSTLIYEILKYKSETNSKIYLAGNIGNPPIEFINELKPNDIVVLELSSFQLQDLERSPHLAVVLDIKVDHLDYHQDKKEYIEAKRNIVRFQNKKDFAVINADYFTSFEFGAITPAQVFWFSKKKSVEAGCWVKNGEFILSINDQDFSIAKTNEVILKGEHNLENICAAITASYLAGADIHTIGKIIKTFKGLEHRLELVRIFNKVSFYNDSFSTTPETTMAALKSFKEPIILFIGGSEKNADYQALAKVIAESTVKAIINIGQTGQKIIDLIQNQKIKVFRDIKSMEEAVAIAKKLAESGDVVLLSPASASFDTFKNYQERGEIFKKIVLYL